MKYTIITNNPSSDKVKNAINLLNEKGYNYSLKNHPTVDFLIEIQGGGLIESYNSIELLESRIQNKKYILND
jgi:hypothetical protein